jgi:hypothetical protein
MIDISGYIGVDLFGYISSAHYDGWYGWGYIRRNPLTWDIVTQIWVELYYDYKRTI